MLEKNEKKVIFDAHFHYFDCQKLNICQFPEGWSGISCAHTPEEWEIQKTAPDQVIQSYGIHPLNCKTDDIYKQTQFLENLIKNNEISAIGETGFDFFTDEYKKLAYIQEEAWNIQLELALKHSLPLIIHCRKANEKLFEYSSKLAKLPEVLFHSFMGTSIEGKSLLNKGINGYFSFGKQIFNGNKKVIDCVKNLPEERILAETDAPFQFLKDEKFTEPQDIIKIQETINSIISNR